ncbi:MAG: carbon storage regulator [Planctomycetota bacterium]
MLVLSRKVGDRVLIGDQVTVVISKIAGNRVTLAIEAPDSMHIIRAELPQEERERLSARSHRSPSSHRLTTGATAVASSSASPERRSAASPAASAPAASAPAVPGPLSAYRSAAIAPSLLAHGTLQLGDEGFQSRVTCQ